MRVGHTYAVGSPAGPRVKLITQLENGDCKVEGCRGNRWTTTSTNLYEPAK